MPGQHPRPTATTARSLPVGLASASVYPESTATAFELAKRLGYDGIEIMVWTDPVSQDIDALRRLADHYQVRVLAIHAPCLVITQRVWGADPVAKLERSAEAARLFGASTVVVHPPFRWQFDYARGFERTISALEEETGVAFAIENMFPLRVKGREVSAYAPDWSPVTGTFRNLTLDLSHTATAQSDALAMYDAMGDRLVHLHVGDGSGSGKDEHLVPGRGTQPCAEILQRVAGSGFGGAVVVEVNTRRAISRSEREADLAEALAFTRLNLARPASASTSGFDLSESRDGRPR